MAEKLLVINPGSTSTKIGVFEDEELVFEKTLRHSVEELAAFEDIFGQYKFRKDIIMNSLEENNIARNSLTAIVGRGGLLKPIEGGTYEVNETMLKDLQVGVQGEHASNLGGILAYEIARGLGIKSFIVDPTVVDELDDVARISGLKEIERRSIFHALNQKAVARRHSRLKDRAYEEMSLIVVHLGGGISVGAHKRGRVVEVANALDGEGPFSPERTGGLPVGDLIKMAYSGKYSYEELCRMIKGQGGLVSYLATNNAIEVNGRIENGDKEAQLVYYAMAYQVAKEVGSCAAVLNGQVDGILLTGGIAHDEEFTGWIREKVEFIAPVYVYPGEDELTALAQGGLRILRGEEVPKEYK